MIFSSPWMLLLALPWLAGWWLFSRHQRRALDWIGSRVAPRFRSLFTVHSPATLRAHLLLIAAMGLLLIVAAAGPALPGVLEGEVEGGRLVLILDASASMAAGDAGPWSPGGEAPASRLVLAREVALELVSRLPGWSFAMGSYSGEAALHLPMSANAGLVSEALERLEMHGYYRSTGSSLAGALDLVLHFQDERRPDLQAVLIGDGELPQPEDYSAPLAALAEGGIPVHTIAVGSLEGQGRRILDFRDLLAGKDPPAVLREFHTRRVDEHFERISRRSGGVFGLASAATLDRVVREVLAHGSGPARFEERQGAEEIGFAPLLAFLAAFLLDALWIGHWRRRADFRFDVERIGAAVLAAALLLPLLAACGGSPRARANRENEAGILLDQAGRHDSARPRYERSIAYRVEPQIPTYNLARSVTLKGDYSEAHRLYQEALRLSPDLAEAHYNDGVALWRWGEAQRDPEGCRLGPTRNLWQQAIRRFERAAELAPPDSELGRRAGANLEVARLELEEIERLIADPPEACEEPPPPSEGGGGGGGGGDQGGGGGEGEGEGEGGGGGEGEGEGEEGEGEGGGGGGEDPESGPPPPLGGEELEQIGRELERIAAQAREEGKFHRRTRAEQFPRKHWENPEKTIWW